MRDDALAWVWDEREKCSPFRQIHRAGEQAISVNEPDPDRPYELQRDREAEDEARRETG